MKPVLSRVVRMPWMGVGKKVRCWYEYGVNVWRDKAELNRYRLECGGRLEKGGAVAFFWEGREKVFVVDQKGRLCRWRQVGELNFHVGGPILFSTITHECFHAVMGLARRMGKNPSSARTNADVWREERFAIVHDQLFDRCGELIQEAATRMPRKAGKQGS